jgi:hypothetical protein
VTYAESPARKEYLRNYQREWLKRRRLAYLAGKKCASCGSEEDLEIDHIDPATKDPELRRGTGLWGWRLDRREAELAKCQVLCHACHVVKTLAQRRKAQHGGPQMYQAHKCRCDLCRKYKLDSSRKHGEIRKQRNLERCQSDNGPLC